MATAYHLTCRRDPGGRNGAVRLLNFVTRLLSAIVLAVWLAGPLFAQAIDLTVVPANAPRLALVLSNGKYPFSPLANPPNDGATMTRALRKLNFDVVEGSDLDGKKMWRAIEAFSNRVKASGPETVGLVFYAGHGLENDGENYIVPVDADIKSKSEIKRQTLSVKDIAVQLSQAGNQINILVLDACRNNPFRAFRDSSVRGLTAMGAVYGVFIASSTAAGDVALDGVGEKNSPYTRALSEALTAPGHALDDVFNSVRRRVMAATSQQQIPWESSSLVVKFYFIPPPEQVPASQQLLEAARQTRNLELLELVAQKYASSSAAAEAGKLSSEIRREAAAKAATEALRSKDAALKNREAEELKARDADALRAREADALKAKQADVLRAREAEAHKARDAERSIEEMARTVMQRAEETRNPETFDLVASLFPGTKYAPQATSKAATLRAEAAAAIAQPQLEGTELVRAIQSELLRVGCFQEPVSGRFDPATVQGLRAFSSQSDARLYWHRPTMGALRALKKETAETRCGTAQAATRPKCMQVNDEAICE